MKSSKANTAPNRLSVNALSVAESMTHDTIYDMSDNIEERTDRLVNITRTFKTLPNWRTVTFPDMPDDLNSFARSAIKVGCYTPAEIGNEGYFRSMLGDPDIAFSLLWDMKCRTKKNPNADNDPARFPKLSSRRSFERKSLARMLMCWRVIEPIWKQYLEAVDEGRDTSEHVEEMNSVALCLLTTLNATFQLNRECFDDKKILSNFVRGYAKACREHNRVRMDKVLRDLTVEWRADAAARSFEFLPEDYIFNKAYDGAMALAAKLGVKVEEDLDLSFGYMGGSLGEDEDVDVSSEEVVDLTDYEILNEIGEELAEVLAENAKNDASPKLEDVSHLDGIRFDENNEDDLVFEQLVLDSTLPAGNVDVMEVFQ